jgi:hypothetical protein
MTPTCFVVTLVFEPPGPLHSSMLLAVDMNAAVALATLAAVQQGADTPLHGVAAFPVPVETLRSMLREVEGREAGEVVSLVPKNDNATHMKIGADRLCAARERLAADMDRHVAAGECCRHGYLSSSPAPCPQCTPEPAA